MVWGSRQTAEDPRKGGDWNSLKRESATLSVGRGALGNLKRFRLGKGGSGNL